MPDKSGYYSGSIANGVTNPAYIQTHRSKKQDSVDKNSDSFFDDEDIIEENDEDFPFWDRNQDSGLVSSVSVKYLQQKDDIFVSKTICFFSDDVLLLIL